MPMVKSDLTNGALNMVSVIGMIRYSYSARTLLIKALYKKISDRKTVAYFFINDFIKSWLLYFVRP